MARREAGRALIRFWLGRAVGRVGAGRGLTQFRSAPAPPSFSYACDGLLTAPASPRAPETPSLNAREQAALVHLGGYAGALQAGGDPTSAGPDPDFRRAAALRQPGDRPLPELLELARQHLVRQAPAFYALVFALQERGSLDAADVRRLVLRARLCLRR
jgi:hypothetical protein